ncbi:MAG: hypothetical protein AAGJ11_13610 [Bacteroidota bacterium]
MFSTPIPRTSFLDSSLRAKSLRSRRMNSRHSLGATHLGHGRRTAPDRGTIGLHQSKPVETTR